MLNLDNGPPTGHHIRSTRPELDFGQVQSQVSVDSDSEETSTVKEIRDAVKTPYVIIPKDIKEQIKENPQDKFLALIAGYIGTRGHVCSDFSIEDGLITLYTSYRHWMFGNMDRKVGCFPIERLIEVMAIDRVTLKEVEMRIEHTAPTGDVIDTPMPGVYL